jgi:tRNA(Met) C34 N-acetyltransferase TmcA
VAAPVPQPISSTLSPAAASARATSRSVTARTRRSTKPPSPTQRGPATVFQYSCCAVLAILPSVILGTLVSLAAVDPEPRTPAAGADLLVVDETSMVDVPLMRAVFRALPTRAGLLVRRLARFVHDSLVEGDGFELSVPGRAIRPFGRGEGVFQ